MKIFSQDPIKPLLSSGNRAINYFTKRDILQKPVEEMTTLLNLPVVQKVIKKQTSGGFWKSTSANKKKHPAQNYDLLETYRHTNILVHQYRLTKLLDFNQKGKKLNENWYHCYY
jgi:D-alanyl-D-alanine carboxypeptidase